jgi:putative CocE/NonD family hydrolase
MPTTTARCGACGAALVMMCLTGATRAAQDRALDHPLKIQYNARIAMRDGVRLSADIYRPEDSARHPAIFELTPYGNNSNGSIEAAWHWVQRGYAFVTVDARGRFDSDGEFTPYRHDGKDGSDVMDWVAGQPWSNGKIATVGGSYLGKVQWEMAKEHNPHHVAMAPDVAPQDDWHDESRYNGVPKLDLMYTWLMGMDGRVMQSATGWHWDVLMKQLPLIGLDRANGRDIKIWQDMMTHDTLDEFWAPLQMRGHYDQFKIPSFNVTGWYEGQLRGTVQGYENVARNSATRDDHVLIIGPWLHAVNRNRRVGERDGGPTAIIKLDEMRDAWLDHYMLGTPRPDTTHVMYFLPVKNEWRHAEAWPLPATKFTPYFLESGGHANTLNGDGVLQVNGPGAGTADAFVYDPANPVLTVSSRTAGARGGLPQGPVDNRAVESRPDVLVYTSAPLAEGMEMTGPIASKVFFSTDVLDTDITVKLLDVGPDGRALNLAEGIARARYRNSASRPEMLVPGKTYAIDVELFPTSNYFEAGHRVRIEVSSSDFPNFGRNLNTGNNNETTSEIRVAHTRILHSKDAPSSITLPVIPVR